VNNGLTPRSNRGCPILAAGEGGPILRQSTASADRRSPLKLGSEFGSDKKGCQPSGLRLPNVLCPSIRPFDSDSL